MTDAELIVLAAMGWAGVDTGGRMTDKERAVIELIEAAVAVVMCEEVISTGIYGSTAMVKLCGAIDDIKALDAEQEKDMKYKWLAMDAGKAITFEDKPHWGACRFELGSKDSWRVVGHDNPPPFLKPGQLWERCEKVENDDPDEMMWFTKWRGYWWRLAEDHSTTCTRADNDCPVYPRCTEDCVERKVVEDSTPWITDHRPTEDDAWNGYVYNADLQLIKWDNHNIQTKSFMDTFRPWQPVPHCLRVKPVEPKCDGCVHYSEVADSNSDEYEPTGICWEIRQFQPTYGMTGCQFKRKED